MSLDISNILRDWPYEPGQVTARRIRGDDGADKIQLRLDLGLYQMETTGRPDGVRPNDCESLLEHCQQQLDKHIQDNGSDADFDIAPEVCEQLRAEGVMYYHRYLAEFILEDFPAVERDTSRNLRLMDLCAKYAREDSDRTALEQFRPYVIMMSTRAKALVAFRQNRPKAALAAVKSGIDDIRSYHEKFGQTKLVSATGELAILRAMAKEIQARLPVDPVRQLRRDLSKAVLEERYEDAAVIRDQLRQHAQERQESRTAEGDES